MSLQRHATSTCGMSVYAPRPQQVVIIWLWILKAPRAGAEVTRGWPGKNLAGRARRDG
jgi:hypothetical protein